MTDETQVPQDGMADNDDMAQQVADNAEPAEVNVDEMLAQIKSMQAQIDAMNAARGVPSDPVEAALQNLVEHVKAHEAQNPHHDFSGLFELLHVSHSDLVSRDAEKIQVVAEKVRDMFPHLDLKYVVELARDLRTAVLDAA